MDDVVIWGAGAIGGTIGAYLARAGANPILVDTDAAHVAALNANGLKITGAIEEFSVNVRAVTPDQVKGPIHQVLLAVKGQHSAAATRMIAPLLAADGSVLSLQNGLNAQAIAAEIGAERTLLALVNFASDYIEPGVIHYGGRGSVLIGELDGRVTPRVADYVALLKRFDDAIEASNNVLGLLWGKIGYAGLLIATSLTNDTMADVLGDRRWQPLLGHIGGEIMRAARADGVTAIGVDGFDAEGFGRGDEKKIASSCDEMADHYRHSAKTRSGIWRDLAVRKRKTETGPLLGPVIAAGQRHGIATPTVARLAAMIGEMEEGQRGFGQDNLAELARI
jgi:2-dehydropantoate 2-reductase